MHEAVSAWRDASVTPVGRAYKEKCLKQWMLSSRGITLTTRCICGAGLLTVVVLTASEYREFIRGRYHERRS